MILFVLSVLSFCCCGNVSAMEKIEIDPSKTLFWGPGLNPEKVTMRARYFFIQLSDARGKNLTESPGEDVISTEIRGKTELGHACHIWTQLLDCIDGSFIIRYKLYNTCFDLNIKVKLKDREIPLLSLEFKGPIFEEECYCPNSSLDAWSKDYECSESYEQIESDLKPFPSVDFAKIRNDVIKEYNRPNSVSICHYVIKDNRIYRQCYGQHVGFKIFMDTVLLSLARKVLLPDTEFFSNLGDWPLVPKHKRLFPIFSWCGSEDTRDIVLPTYDITDSSLECMGRVMTDMLSVQGNTKVPWEKKIEKLFWRGRDSRRERLDLIDISRKHPDLFNASITNFFFFTDQVEKYGPGERHESFFNFFRYKYQLNIDGTVAAYRFPYLLASDALVLKQESKYYEYFYRDVIPGVHYVPVKSDLSDLVEKIQWAKEHDAEARNISRAARSLMRNIALPHHVLCYHVSLLREWSRRLETKVEVSKDMEEVPQPGHSCKCNGVVETGDSNSKDEL